MPPLIKDFQMLTFAVVLHLIVSAGLFAMAYKYITAQPPLDYHADILATSAVTPEFKLILGALYKAMGGAFAALGAGTALIAITGVWNDLFSAKLALIVMAGTAGYIATQAAHSVESQTKVKTPWRISAGLAALAALAFVLSLF